MLSSLADLLRTVTNSSGTATASAPAWQEALRARRIVVTGGDGDLGRAIVSRLREAGCDNLLVCDRRPIAAGTRMVDLADPAQWSRLCSQFKPEIVIHAAGVSEGPAAESSPEETIRQDLLIAVQTAEIALLGGVSRFVLASLDQAARPRNYAAVAKRLAEDALRQLDPSRTTALRAPAHLAEDAAEWALLAAATSAPGVLLPEAVEPLLDACEVLEVTDCAALRRVRATRPAREGLLHRIERWRTLWALGELDRVMDQLCDYWPETTHVAGPWRGAIPVAVERRSFEPKQDFGGQENYHVSAAV